MMRDKSLPFRAAYYRSDEKTEAGEAIFHFRLYGFNGRWLHTKPVSAGELADELDALRKQGIPAQRVT